MANSWRTERWDSLRLLTPNWLNRLPGLPYDGPDPDGYLTMPEVVGLVERFAAYAQAPVRTGTTVTSVRGDGGGYVVETRPSTGSGSVETRPSTGSRSVSAERALSLSKGEPIHCRAVVIATGAFNLPNVPAFATAVPDGVQQLTPFDYRRPDQLAEGGVLVVGASATGVQLAAEIARTGRPVTLSVGEHVRMPRTYRGRDVLWWMDAGGIWDERWDALDDVGRARRLPSPQLVGTPERATLDLNALTDLGVELVGRWSAVRDGVALFSGGLRNVFSLADLKLARLLDSFDAWAVDSGADVEAAPERHEPTRVPPNARWQIDLRRGEFATVLWATGSRPDYRWLDVPVVDAKGRLRHEGGLVDSPGLYALGLPVLRRRRSTFLNGIEADASEVVEQLAGRLAQPEKSAR